MENRRNKFGAEASRIRAADGNVIRFPKGDEVRLEQAIERFDAGDATHELLEEFRALADKGLREANYFLGLIYEDGTNGAETNVEKALDFYEESVNGLGYVEGYLAVARLMYHGLAGPRDYDKAFQYYEHVARKDENPIASFMIGRMYQHGQGVAKNLNTARAWYRQAIARGNVYGILNLALLEAEEGNVLKGILLRIHAYIKAVLIVLRNRRDIRLRGG
jgi:TPR repeat protein